MKVAYVFITPRAATYKLGQMILPQLEAGTHGVEVVGMFFFDDNAFVLRQGRPDWRATGETCEGEGYLADDVRCLCVGAQLSQGRAALVQPRRHRAHDARRGCALQHR
jgi:hypothetical protein